MELSEYKNIFENEDKHFFYVGNHEIILSLIRCHKPKGKLKILDAGCGTGLLAKELTRFGQVVAVDTHPEAIRFAKKRGVKTQQASVMALPYPNSTFNVVTCIDVLYHKNVKDTKALSEFSRVLKKGGVLVVRVPAIPWLITTHDKYVHTRHRYNKRELRDKLTKAGFTIKKLSFVNMILLPLVLAKYVVEKASSESSSSSGVMRLPSFVNYFLTWMLKLEKHFLPYFDLPFGLGLITVCKK